jgi:hypothetical protein
MIRRRVEVDFATIRGVAIAVTEARVAVVRTFPVDTGYRAVLA